MSTATASTMKYVSPVAIMKHRARIHAKLSDAAGALIAATDKIGQVEDEFVDEDGYARPDIFQLKEARATCHVLAGLLESGEAPSHPLRVFFAIASHGNENDKNTPHLEGVIIALMLAEDSLESALELAEQFDGEAIDEAYEAPYAAWSIVKGIVASFGCQAVSFDHEGALEGILRTKRTLAMAA